MGQEGELLQSGHSEDVTAFSSSTIFSVFSPQSLLYKKVNEAQYRSHLANEMMMYHMKVRLAWSFCTS